ncbi:MAG TPA: type II toxin-antitoxin system VapC family toxin [Longimicrobiaceae bacterium]|nr:type II toxin-antitoxin system VapC family toxin [Longimicrobiaceae bacterium]
MRKYVIDTSLYVYATRDEGWNGQLQAFYQAFAHFVYLHSVVAAELLAGATSPELERRTQRHFVAPFEATGRLVTPGHGAWKRAGATVARLVREKRMSPNGIRRSFLNDCLIAASARDHGLTVVTDNLRDFALIGTVDPVEVVPPWPDPRT